jgi:Uma2 family endonuclease
MPPIRSISELDPDKIYTYADYVSWQLTERVELIRGRVRQMAGASITHQRISVRLEQAIGQHLRDKSCELFHAPTDVRLETADTNGTRRVQTVVQPDIFVNCDPARLTQNSCVGPPEWIIEIVSPSNASRDVRDKFDLYQEAGVGEYWIVYPNEQSVSVYALDAATSRYRTVGDFAFPGPIPCQTLPDLVIDWSVLFTSTPA